MDSLFSILFGFLFGLNPLGGLGPQDIPEPDNQHIMRYLPIGDSYTIGEGVVESERWPNQLVSLLEQDGKNLQIIANPSRTGFTTQDALDHELPLVNRLAPEFVTVQIGVNDWVQGVGADTFRSRLEMILDGITDESPDIQILLVTIPDFSVTPSGSFYGGGRDISKGLEGFNEIIREAAEERELPVVDIFEISKQAADDQDMTAADGLHPSGKMYALWAQEIAPVVRELLEK